MKLRMLILSALAFALAVPALAVETSYNLMGDQSTEFPTDGTVLRPGTIYGRAVIDDAGPTLVELTVINRWTDLVGGTLTSLIPGTTVVLNSETTAGPTGGQGGTGSIGPSSSIDWGSLSGWSQTGYLSCVTNCPGGCGGASSCIPFVGFEGLGPPAPLKSTTFPMIFSFDGTGEEFSIAATEFVNLTSGAVTGWLVWLGALVLIPVLPLAAFGGLGAGMVYLGARALRRKNS